MSKDTADHREERRKERTGHQAIMRTIMTAKIYPRLSSIERKAVNTGSRSKLELNKLE